MRFSALTAFLCFFLVGEVHAQSSIEWQQRVHYSMDVSLNTDRHQLTGTQRLTYYNNAPDTLHQVFYHLYFNAFQPESMMAERNRELPDPDRRVVPRIFDLRPDETGYQVIERLEQDGQPVRFEIHDTVMKVYLDHPVLPDDSTVFDLQFHSQIPLQTRRSGRNNREGIDYSMSQWYPKIAAYDSRGWHADPYVGREFYAPFGTFDVRITLPAEYVIGATGVLQNPDEVGHGYLADESLSATNGRDSLTWHFYAENVHDFAWAADPDYLHDRIEGDDGVIYHLLYQPDVAASWEMLRTAVPEIIAYFSERIGPYPYPQFTVVQAGDGGMEYPMINFVTGRRSPLSLLGTVAHEAAHEWFYAALGSNEADFAWLDEGFTSYVTAEVMAHLTGSSQGNHRQALYDILAAHYLGYFEPLNTPSDWFTTNAAYGTAAYSGGEMILDLLGYVISDPLRDRFLQAYYERFKFRHPDPLDVERVAEEVSGMQLDWFFHQFVNRDWSTDYALVDLDSRRSGVAGWSTTIVIERKDDAVIPVDLHLTLSDGSERWVNIPLGVMRGHKPVPEDWIVAEPWYWTSSRYVLHVNLPAEVVRAEIDPLGRTPDRNRLNNVSRLPVRFSFFQAPQFPWTYYSVGYRPLLQYAHDFGFGLGVKARGGYLFETRTLETTLKIWPQVLFSGGESPEIRFGSDETSAFDGIDYILAYSDDVDFLRHNARLTLSARKQLGILENRIDLTQPLAPRIQLQGKQNNLKASIVHQYNPTNRAFSIDGFPSFSRTNIVSAALDYIYADGTSRLQVFAEAGSSISSTAQNGAVSASRFFLDAARAFDLDPFIASLRLRFGAGASNLALHKRFRPGAATLEDRWRNDAYRTVAAAFEQPLDDLHFVAFDGPGPVAYAPSALYGTNILAGSLNLAFAPFPTHLWLRPLALHAFFGAGEVWNGRIAEGFQNTNDIVADAGLGFSFDVSALSALNRWSAQSDVFSGMHFVARFPFWASDPAFTDAPSSPIAFRWLLGIQLKDVGL